MNKKKSVLKYEEKSVFNENGELTSFSTSSSTPKYYLSPVDPSLYATTVISTTSTSFPSDPIDYSKLYSPPPTTTFIPYTNFEFPSSKNDLEKEIKRKEIIDITRMNTLKEILDKFETCDEFMDIYKMVEELKKEYKLLAGIED